jgi:beta-xylosidase
VVNIFSPENPASSAPTLATPADSLTPLSPNDPASPHFAVHAEPHQHSTKRRRAIMGGLVVVVLTAVILIGVSQIQVIRDFLSRASGEKADIVVDTQAVLGPMPRPWRNLAQGGEGFDWRLQPLVPQVKALKPEYIRIDHIYDFYDIVHGTPGNLTFDFSKMDPVVADILATGAKPYIALSYMPPAIAEGDIVSKPKRWEDWQLVVQKTVEHYSGTKGINDVMYEVWNEPDLFGGWKYYGDKSYITLYNYAARGAAQARGVRPFKIGGPGITALYKNWFDAMAKNAINNNVRMDFFSWHRYNHKLEQYRDDMTEVREWTAAYPQLEPTLEFHITEWGHDSNNHAGYDGAYGAAHTVAGAIEMVGVVQRAFVFEIQDGKDGAGKEYWGRWGMFTHQSVGAKPKPRYQALRLLDRIGDQRLQILGKGTWVKGLAARDAEGNTDVVLSNFDQRGANRENVPITYQNIVPGTYSVTQEFLGGRRQTQQVATDAAVLRTYVNMPANSVALVKLTLVQAAEPLPVPVEEVVPAELPQSDLPPQFGGDQPQ